LPIWGAEKSKPEPPPPEPNPPKDALDDPPPSSDVPFVGGKLCAPAPNIGPFCLVSVGMGAHLGGSSTASDAPPGMLDRLRFARAAAPGRLLLAVLSLWERC
jgi:hypothetical protein